MIGLGLSLTKTALSGGPVLSAQASAIVAAAGGVIFDPSRSVMTVARDGTGAAPTTGQAVGRIYDAAGSGRYAIAPSDAARPLLTISGGLAYLAPDGVDDWMQITSTLNLGETWWHVGGWRSVSAGRAAFSLSDAATSKSALRHTSTPVWAWWNAANTAFADTTTSTPNAVHVLTIEDATNIATRYNGVQQVTPIAPFDDSASAQGLALFTGVNSAWTLGMSGRFYGGAWAPGAISAANRTVLEAYVASLSGVTL